jgi:hypothetical protein
VVPGLARHTVGVRGTYSQVGTSFRLNAASVCLVDDDCNRRSLLFSDNAVARWSRGTAGPERVRAKPPRDRSPFSLEYVRAPGTCNKRGTKWLRF